MAARRGLLGPPQTPRLQLAFLAAGLLVVAVVATRAALCRQPEELAPTWLRRQQGHAAAAAAAPAPLISEADAPPGCLLVGDACVDQGVLVLMGRAYRPDAPPAVRKELPKFVAPAMDFFPWEPPLPGLAGSNDVMGFMPIGPGDTDRQLRIRPRSSKEPTLGLRCPVFREDLIPMIWHPMWPYNYGHNVANNAGWLFTQLWLNETRRSWTPWVQLLVRTHDGLALPSFIPELYAPHTAHPVVSLADFSERPPRGSPQRDGSGGNSSKCDEHTQAAAAGSPAAEAASAQQPSAETSGRCFRQLLVCSGRGEQGVNTWQASQKAVRHYQPLSPAPVQYLPDRSARPGGPQQLKVLFVTRPGPPLRQLTNLPQLLEECRRWEWAEQDSGRAFQAACGEWDFTDLRSTIAVMQSADILVAIHGAHIINANFMPPGSSVIEVFPHSGWLLHHHLLQDDPASQIQWWGLDVRDPALMDPGALEQLKASAPGLYASFYNSSLGEWQRGRDRNIRLPWSALEPVLRKAVELRGDMAAYRTLEHDNLVHWELYEGGKMLQPGTARDWTLNP